MTSSRKLLQFLSVNMRLVSCDMQRGGICIHYQLSACNAVLKYSWWQKSITFEIYQPVYWFLYPATIMLYPQSFMYSSVRTGCGFH